MEVFHTKKKLKAHLGELTTKNYTIGMVPTMGALHQGHLALVKRAVAENTVTVVSIFVNPTQFDNQNDLKKYPKTFKEDSVLLNQISSDIIVFVPSVEEMYKEGVKSARFDFAGLESVMEGRFREGHFDGVATIVRELLTLVSPQRAYFGEKDFQQLQIIKALVAMENLPIEIIGCPIVREPGGLAMSSRNERLSKRLRKEASFIYKTLQTAKTKFGTESAEEVVNWVIKVFDNHTDFELEYFEITDAKTLAPMRQKKKNKTYRAFIAVYAEGVRLIDNIGL